MIVGTAGHIDHGKTTLVRALTGVDTDRLPEEKARGISIELGYAYAPLAGGGSLGFVDVPGHERFVHTMLAGATGVDFALLVVAADDGVMPQTREHVALLDILGLRQGAVAITKADRVEAARAAAVEAQVASLLDGTGLAGSPSFRVAAPEGIGVDALREHLHHLAASAAVRAPQGHFRLAVDRSFTLQGIGTVVTGTVHAGAVGVGERLLVLPSLREVRVRGIRANAHAAARAVAGERAALNLAGVAREDVERGDWIVAPALGFTTTRFDARLRWSPDAGAAERGADALHLHAGAGHAMGRVVPLVEPGAQGALVQVIVHEPLHLVQGDRFVLRDAAASRTLGGGVVIDPLAPARYRRSPERLASLVALERPTPLERLEALADAHPGGVELARFARAANIVDPGALLAGSALRPAGAGEAAFAVAPRHWEAMSRRLDEALAGFHGAHPDDIGPELARLRRIALPRVDPVVYRALLEARLASGAVVRTGAWIRLASYDTAPSASDRALLEKLEPRLAEAGFDPPWVRDLARDAGVADDAVRGTLARAARRGSMFAVVRDLYYPAQTVAALEAILRELQETEGEVRAAAFRDRTGLGRKRAIQILEFFDRVGLTRRVRERHFLRTDATSLVGR